MESYGVGWMKYIIVDDMHPYVFPRNVMHQNFAFQMNIPKESITSAGFIRFTGENGAECEGESLSLHIQARPVEDAALFNDLACDWS